MFLIEDLMKIVGIKYTALNIYIDVLQSGYKFSITKNSNYDWQQYYEERKELVRILSQFDDLYIIKICDGSRYVIKLMYIRKAYYFPKMARVIIVSTDFIILKNIYIEDIEIMQKLGIEITEKIL